MRMGNSSPKEARENPTAYESAAGPEVTCCATLLELRETLSVGFSRLARSEDGCRPRDDTAIINTS